MNIFEGMMKLWIFGGGGSSQIWTIFKGHFFLSMNTLSIRIWSLSEVSEFWI